ncbi:aspartic peptidase domain-containing protein [Xylaria sp. FL1042]|nr:aspartic peptidase domain-containing protein [Xylaria sp. FL1042]
MDLGLSVPPLFTLVLASLASTGGASIITRSSADEQKPAALVISPSEYFEGNDGPWSTFNLRVGTPEQDVRVIVSTASPESFVVLSDYGCSASVFDAVPPNCAVSRGNLLNSNGSSSWHDLGLFGINEDGVGLEANLGYSVRADFATETVGLGLTGPSLDNQTVAGIATAEPFYLGVFGLNNQPVNFTSLGNFSSPSFLTTLKDQGLIPSLSWSYTAGAKYRLKQVYGQLIFSGYDTSRFVENSASFTMAGDVTRDLVVVLQSISYSGSTSATLLSDAIDIFVDSTDPNLWLPEDVCDAFEMAFGLTLDNTTGLYLINDTQHDALLNSDAEVTFRLSDVNSGGEAVKIVFPYAAFDLTAQYPLVQNQSYYFPLKRAANSTQYTLGRTFLQEAYLTADYERRVFNVSACSWVEGAEENIVTIPSKDSGTDGSSSSSGNSHLSGGAIAGIVIGAVIAAILIAAAIIYLIRRQRKKKSFAAQEPAPDMAVITGPVHNHHSSRRTGKYYSPDTVGTSTDAGGSENTGGTNGELTSDDSGQQELDGEGTQVGRTATPSEDGAHAHQLHDTKLPLNEQPTPVYHELGGREITNTKPDTRSNLGRLPLRTGKAERDNHLDSPFVSTLGSLGWQDEGEDASSDMVSPNTPVRRGSEAVEI